MTQPVVEFTYEDYRAVSVERGRLSIVPAANLKRQKDCLKSRASSTSTTISWSGVAREEHGS